ncbi:hypothetical protein GB927_014465 [Shinella sp. CPCC 100929]|uniref:Uncharacterized protein n=1 Tax=Shinella lacus TaxID=2654216 RepID=A0ABT1R7U2_9HYPH|nr:hypothetical protein [Shinella lacus]MCQ4631254.1 hypothetical protein [Shinella lacus]
MTKFPGRLVRRLDDGRVVYRLHLRAKAVVLSEVEFQAVERLVLRRWLIGVISGIGILLSVLLSLHLYRHGIVSSVVLVIFVAVLVVLATIAEKRLLTRANAMLDAAPVSAADRLEAVPSQIKALRIILRNSIVRAPRLVFWALLLYLGITFFGALFALVEQVRGKAQIAPDIHPAILVTLSATYGLCLLLVLRARRAAEHERR